MGRKRSSSPLIWTFTTYFAEGFPFILIRTISTFFFRASGVSLEATGLTSLFGLPWTVKFLWAPFLDSYGTKRKWLLTSQAALAMLFVLITLFSHFSWSISFLAVLFLVASFAAATHDIAIDGYYLEALDSDGQAKFVGYRVMAYRIAMMFGTAVIVTIGTHFNWSWAFFLSAVILLLLFLFHFLFLPICETQKRKARQIFAYVFSRNYLILLACTVFFLAAVSFFKDTLPLLAIKLPSLIGLLLLLSLFIIIALRKVLLSKIQRHAHAPYAQAFLTFVDRERIGVILFFIILVRAGEFMLSAMVGPFFIDFGFADHYGWITGAVGLPCSIIGAMSGGWLISRYSLKKMIWPFLLAQNVTNLTYMALASFLVNLSVQVDSGQTANILQILLVAAVTAFDHLAGGLGTAVLMTFLMGLCRGNYKAAHYAIGTGLMSVSGVYAGSFSGFLVNWIGYAPFFGVSFLLSLPGMALIFFLPDLQSQKAS